MGTPGKVHSFYMQTEYKAGILNGIKDFFISCYLTNKRKAVSLPFKQNRNTEWNYQPRNLNIISDAFTVL